jgi:hypothetical protein
VASFSLQWRWSGAAMGVARGRRSAAASALWFGAGGGRRRPAGYVAHAFTKRKHIPRNTPKGMRGPSRPTKVGGSLGRSGLAQ